MPVSLKEGAEVGKSGTTYCIRKILLANFLTYYNSILIIAHVLLEMAQLVKPDNSLLPS
jgi:hypothetical protein